MKAEATLKKISEMLNISISTVSRALKDHPDISDRTKKRVQELAVTLEYEPNTYAINLRMHHSKVFGVILPTLSNNFYQAFVAKLEEDARNNGYSLLIIQSFNDENIELQSLKLFRANKVAGVFVCLSPNSADVSEFLKMESRETPVIFFDKVPVGKTCNKVCIADEQAAAMAAELLIAKEKKSVLALFGNESMSITRKRFNAFKQTYFSALPNALVHTVHADSTEEAKQLTEQYFDENGLPEAVFCMSDEVLIGAMKVLQQRKIDIPNEVAVIAISNGFFPQLFHPVISYIETSGTKLAQLAFNRMMACLAGSTFVQELTLEAVYVKGDSV